MNKHGGTFRDELEVSKMSRGKKWGNINNSYNQKHFSNGHSFGNRPQHNKPQDNRQGKQWGQKSKDSKITLIQESAHFIPTEFSSSFFKQFNLAMKLNWEEMRKQERNSTQVNEITEGDLIQAFGVTEDQMEKQQQCWAGVKRPKNREIHQPDYQRTMELRNKVTAQKKKRYFHKYREY